LTWENSFPMPRSVENSALSEHPSVGQGLSFKRSSPTLKLDVDQ
jgi:hypothetical protein